MEICIKLKSLFNFCLQTLITVGTVYAQSSYQAPLTIDGHPDIQGVWANNTVTPVQRPDVFEGREFLTAEEMQIISTRAGEITADTDDALFGESVITSALTGDVKSNDPSTGNYDQFWAGRSKYT